MKEWLNNFAEKHPKAAQWIREGGLFIIFSYVVTFIKYLILQFLPNLFHNLVGDASWMWPGIKIAELDPQNVIYFSLIGNPPGIGASSGLSFTLANLTAIFLGECINFPLQRNVTFKSHGPVVPQAICHFLATVVVFLVMNQFTCIWNPVASHFGIPDFIFNIVTTVVTGGVAMVIIFAVDKTIFTPGWGQKKAD